MKTTTTANEQYKMIAKRVGVYLEILKTCLDDHAEKQSEKPRDWGFVGDISYIEDKLKEAIGEDADELFMQFVNGDRT